MLTLAQGLEYYLGIPAHSLPAVESWFMPLSLAKGDCLVREGQPCRHMAFVQQGHLRVWAQGPGDPVTQWISSPGQFTTCLRSFVFGGGSRWTIEALESAQLLALTQEGYAQLHQQVPEWPALEKRFLGRCFVQVEDRMFGMLSLDAEARFKALMAQAPDLFNRVPLQHLASMLGMRPETLSRLRSRHSS